MSGVDVLAALAAEALKSAGCYVEAQKLKRTPINPQAHFGCILRTLGAIDTSSRMRWGLRHDFRSLAEGAAAEALDLLRAGITATLASSAPEEAWLSVLIGRAAMCVARAGGRPGDALKEEATDVGDAES